MSLQAIQTKIGTIPDGKFGAQTSKALQRFLGLNIVEASHFIGQCWHESGGFARYEENLNYSAERLLVVFPKYFTTPEARARALVNKKPDLRPLASEYANKPEMIGNLVYANRMGNGAPETGDGFRHRGQGLIQLTGKTNQFRFADFIGDQRIKKDPSLIGQVYGLESADYFFKTNGVYQLCDDMRPETIRAVTLRINGGTNGLQDREDKTLIAFRWLSSK